LEDDCVLILDGDEGWNSVSWPSSCFPTLL
jgi:hypothetical protein